MGKNIKVIITTVPFVDWHTPLVTPGYLKAILKKRNIDCVGLDLNIEIYNKIKTDLKIDQENDIYNRLRTITSKVIRNFRRGYSEIVEAYDLTDSAIETMIKDYYFCTRELDN